MKTTPAKTDAALAKRALNLEGIIKRAVVRRDRAIDLGNQREADGAQKTIDEAREDARICRKALAGLR